MTVLLHAERHRPAVVESQLGMSRILALAVGVVVMTGCASGRSPSKAVYTHDTTSSGPLASKTVYVHGTKPDDDNSQTWHPRAFKVGTQRFGTLEEFKTFIATLPPGSVVHWDSGCIGYEMMPLAHSNMSVEEFSSYCQQHGVKFEHVVSGY